MAEVRSVTAAESRQIQLDILETIDRIARDHGIDYTVAFGTLLGAVRHGGYIPWDDDVDLELTRDSYDALMPILAAELPEHLTLMHYSVHPVYLPFAKVYDNRTAFTSRLDMLNRGTGVFVDLFPVDVVPDDAAQRLAFTKEVRKASIRLAASNAHGIDFSSASTLLIRLAKLVLWLPTHLRYRGRWRELAAGVDHLLQRYNPSDGTDCGFLGTLTVPNVVPREVYLTYEDVGFEGRTVRKVADHDTYLRRNYGDYLTPPPEGRRENHSYYRWFWKADPTSD